jgi:hypothetical protein
VAKLSLNRTLGEFLVPEWAFAMGNPALGGKKESRDVSANSNSAGLLERGNLTSIGVRHGTTRDARRRTVTLVIPARNEARNLPWVLERIPDCVDEVILVDGFSTDATQDMADFCRPTIRHVSQKRRGKGAGLLAGFEAAQGDYVLMIDADGSMDPEEIPRYIWYLDHGFDFVKGSRFVAGGGSLDITHMRRLGNWALMMIAKIRFGTQLTDLCYGYCGFHRRWLPALGLSASGFEIETEMTLQAITAGLRIGEVPSLEMPRRSGRSNLRTFRDGWRVLRTILGTPRIRPMMVGPSRPESPTFASADSLPDTKAG